MEKSRFPKTSIGGTLEGGPVGGTSDLSGGEDPFVQTKTPKKTE